MLARSCKQAPSDELLRPEMKTMMQELGENFKFPEWKQGSRAFALFWLKVASNSICQGTG